MGQNTGNVRRSGYTILELMIALVVLTIAIGGISSSLASTSSLSRATEMVVQTLRRWAKA
jgi:prepilin-type N-terminal cleavage/methylation domain-containing protein